MVSQRMSMFKALFRFMQSNTNDLKYVYSFVDEILCSDPSLIRSSAKKSHNEVQDTVLMWLMHKFFKYNNMHIQKNQLSMQQVNLRLQQRILASCVINRPVLFARFIVAYSKAIEEMLEKQMACFANKIEIVPFICNDACMRNIEQEFRFELFPVHSCHIEPNIDHCLKILTNALLYSNNYTMNLFEQLLKCIYKVLQHGGISNKFIGLCYLQQLLTLSKYRKLHEPHNTCIILSFLKHIWHKLPTWHAIGRLSSFNEYLEITIDILIELEPLCVSVGDFEHMYNVLELLLLECKAEDLTKQKLIPLCNSYFHMMCTNAEFKLTQEHNQLLLKIACRHATFARLLVPQLNNQTYIMWWNWWQQQLNKGENIDLLMEFAQNMHFAMYYYMFNSKSTVCIENFVNAVVFNAGVKQYLQLASKYANATATCMIEERVKLIRIAGLLLNTVDRFTISDEYATILKNCLLNIILQVLTNYNNNNYSEELIKVALEELSHRQLPMDCQLKLQNYAGQIASYMLTSNRCLLYCEYLPRLLATKAIKPSQVYVQLIMPLMRANAQTYAKELGLLWQSVLCVKHYITYISIDYNTYETEFLHECKICGKINEVNDVDSKQYQEVLYEPEYFTIDVELAATLKPCIRDLMLHERFISIAKHLEDFHFSTEELLYIVLHCCDFEHVHIPAYLSVLTVCHGKIGEILHEPLAEKLLQQIYRSVNCNMELKSKKLLQLKLLQLLVSCAQWDNVDWLFVCFKMSFYFMIHFGTQVLHDAVIAAVEMCEKRNRKPIELWHWYKTESLQLVVDLILHAYLEKGIPLTRTIKAFSKMLGFSCVQEFICKYYRQMTTLLLARCVDAPQGMGIFVAIMKATHKTFNELLKTSFLSIYSHVNLLESNEVQERCLKWIQYTNTTIKCLMKNDVKITVSGLLVYFNRNPQFVMQAFKYLFEENKQHSNSEFNKFVSDRFLGIMTSFESCFSEPNMEKSVKQEMLYSFGQIMRSVGTEQVTHFRFKIVAMLTFVLSLKHELQLQRICLKIWEIFLRIINMEVLGPSLNRIVLSLQPLLSVACDEVNNIYEYIILNNKQLVGNYLSDLYFMQGFKGVSSSILTCVKRHTEFLHNNELSVLDKLKFYCKQVQNECLQVRITALQHLQSFIAKERAAINQIILCGLQLNGKLLHRLVNTLIEGCWHEDRNLQLVSALCLGEFGAIDPSYILCKGRNNADNSVDNVVIHREFIMDLRSDQFALMALQELCRAYQFQKDTKYVDNFSLAIQETLAFYNISPTKRQDAWAQLPDHVHQIITPLLKSCYTPVGRDIKCSHYPLFGSSEAYNFEDWAFLLTSRLIDIIPQQDTRYLFKCYLPSIKRDNKSLATFFPYILLQALIEGNDNQRQIIFEEFDAIFRFAADLKFHSADLSFTANLQSKSKEFVSQKYSAICHALVPSGKDSEGDSLECIARTCCKFCAEQIEFLQHWCHLLSPDKSKIARLKLVDSFIVRFDHLQMSKSSYNSLEYTRALMYLESYILDNKDVRLQEQISFMIQIYGELQDTDSVEGALQLKKTALSLSEEILVYRLVERNQDSLICYEQLLNTDKQISPENIKGLIDCYLNMQTPQTAQLISDGLWRRAYDQYADVCFKQSEAEILWRLSNWDEMEKLAQNMSARGKICNSWSLQWAHSLVLFREPCMPTLTFNAQLDLVRSCVMLNVRNCSSAQQQAITPCYDELIKLHILSELQTCKKLLNDWQEVSVTPEECRAQLVKLFSDWQSRLCIVRPVVRTLEPLLALRRSILQSLISLVPDTHKLILQEVINEEIGKLWQCSARYYRKAGHLQQAQLSIMKAEQYAPPSCFIEKAKLLWMKSEQSKTFKLLKDQLQKWPNVQALEPVDRSLYLEAKLMLANYSARSMHTCSEQNLRYYEEALAANRKSERVYLHLAQYLEKVYDAFTDKKKSESSGRKILLDVMLNYAKSLRWGLEHVYESLPRLLTLWLDTTALPHCELELSRKMNDLITNCCNSFPTFMFYTALSQVLSRLCHPNVDVFSVLREIMIKLLEHFPQQTIWMMLPLLKSAQPQRMKRCKLILMDSRLNHSISFQKLLNDFNKLAERLIELTNKEIQMDRTHKLSELVPQLTKLLLQSDFSKIMLPFEKFMQVYLAPSTCSASLPNSNASQSEGDAKPCTKSPTLNPFPHKQIYMCSINEDVVVLQSAARPKRISIRCSDGKQYDVMLKPKDDLRKDFRLMELNGLVKRHLHQNVQARHRQLYIRTYAAIPFNDECGLVEWVPNLRTFRNICMCIYRARNLGLPDTQLRKFMLPARAPKEDKRRVFKDILLAKHPPVFQDWLRQRFASSSSWYEARCAYIKTVAVMSMVGYILGLGDRHGENILLDETCGDIVHVDYNALFNYGETFTYPECVPFRLTHNMVYAMGPLGVEGLFRRCCEITLRLLRAESRTLLSVLQPFVYDSATLARHKGRSKNHYDTEATDPKAVVDMRRIEERLQGYVQNRLSFRMPLSVEGQVNFLIDDATDVDNLAAMYLGWGPHI